MHRSPYPLAVFVALLAGACARTPAPPAPTPAGARADTAALRPRTVAGTPYRDVRPVPVPPAFQDAVSAGTRTLTGQPGPKYWQQRVNYAIDAELDPKTAKLQGEERITYVNNSPDTLGGLVLHLYQNMFKAGAPRVDEVPVTGGMTIERVSAGGREIPEARAGRAGADGPAYRIANTLMGLQLPRALLPGDTAHLEIDWHYTVPPAGAPRQGHDGKELYLIAQWYPQVAVYDDVNGWDTHEYLGRGEFYLEYGDFDVSITLPEGYLVGATGELANADEVLNDRVRERLALAARSDSVVHVVRQSEMGAGPDKATAQVPGGELTWRFRARDVRDFAFAASNRYLWDAARATTPDSAGGTRSVLVQALYRPEARTWREAARYTQHAIDFHSSHWHPYIYPQMTSVEGPEGGMEYPMIVFVSAYSDPHELYTTITHEVGHEWFPMMVGSDEHAFAWQDEGLNTYIENLATEDFYKGENAFDDEMQGYLSLAGTGDEVDMQRHSDITGPYNAYAVAAYLKPGLVMRSLWSVVGRDTVRQILRAYADRWLLKHPQPLDFFDTGNAVAGRDLSWFWYPWWYTTDVLDQAVVGVESTPAAGGQQASITIANNGGVIMPTVLQLTLANGQTQTVKLPADVWLPDVRRYTDIVTVSAAVQKVVIDPDQILPDVDRENNVWVRK